MSKQAAPNRALQACLFPDPPAPSLLTSAPEPAALDRLDDLRPLFVVWFDDRIWLDAESVALRRPSSRWSSGVHVLHADFCRGLFRAGLNPVTRDQFRGLLAELCSEIRLVHGEELVSHVALKEDVEAQRVFERCGHD